MIAVRSRLRSSVGVGNAAAYDRRPTAARTCLRRSHQERAKVAQLVLPQVSSPLASTCMVASHYQHGPSRTTYVFSAAPVACTVSGLTRASEASPRSCDPLTPSQSHLTGPVGEEGTVANEPKEPVWVRLCVAYAPVFLVIVQWIVK